MDELDIAVSERTWRESDVTSSITGACQFSTSPRVSSSSACWSLFFLRCRSRSSRPQPPVGLSSASNGLTVQYIFRTFGPRIRDHLRSAFPARGSSVHLSCCRRPPLDRYSRRPCRRYLTSSNSLNTSWHRRIKGLSRS